MAPTDQHLSISLVEWRSNLRALIDGPLRNGWQLAGMTADHRYVLRPPTKVSS